MPADEENSNPLSRSNPLGGRTGVAVASLVPLFCLGLFLLFGFLGGWAWSWVFFLLIPLVLIVIYGVRQSRRGDR